MCSSFRKRKLNKTVPLLHLNLYQIVGVDMMELLCFTEGNHYVPVFKEYLTNWPMVYLMPDQTANRICKLLCWENVPFFEVLEALLSDCGANLLSYLMSDFLCTSLQ